MRVFYLTVLVSSVFLSLINRPDDNFWKDAPTDGVLLYRIYLTDNAGYAVSNNNILFTSYDNGRNWQEADPIEMTHFNSKNFLWSAQICCSSLKTTDGGKNWIPCSSESNNRFCRVFLKDPNTGYQPAKEFLNMVCNKIFSGLLNNEVNLLKTPRQYTEYYSNQDEGWAPGWYLSDLLTFDTLQGLK